MNNSNKNMANNNLNNNINDIEKKNGNLFNNNQTNILDYYIQKQTQVLVQIILIVIIIL